MFLWSRLMNRWSRLVFRERYKDITPHIRALRLLEEVIELCQAEGATVEEIDIVKHQVLSKEKGDIYQELGGVLTTLSAYAATRNFNLEEAFFSEFERLMDPILMEKVRKRNLEGDKIGFEKVIDISLEKNIES